MPASFSPSPPRSGAGPAGRKPGRPRVVPMTAATADKHRLYEASVQHPPTDVAFIDRVFKKRRRRRPLRLREDFCGTAWMAAEWADSHKERKAVGLDLHQPTMDWGHREHVAPLGDAARRVRLMRRNVMDGAGVASTFDAVVAFNFSYCALRSRQEMGRYFRRAARELCPEGAFFLDIHGGTETFEEMEETTRHRGFTYVWDQEPWDAITGFTRRHIHFRFPGGTEMRRAFTYDWRLWTIPELREIALESGFSDVEVYWESATAEGEGSGSFRRARHANNETAWIAYVVAWREP